MERTNIVDEMVTTRSIKVRVAAFFLSAISPIAFMTSCGFIFFANGEHVHPLPAIGEDELGVDIQTTIDVANTAAGSGLHDADCSAWVIG